MGNALNWFPRPTWPAFQLCSVMFLSEETGNGKKQSHILLRCFCMIPPGNTPFATRRPLFVCFGYKKSTSYITLKKENKNYYIIVFYFFYIIYILLKKMIKKKIKIIINPNTKIKL